MRIVCDLRKAQWCEYGYVNQHGDVLTLKPKGPSNHGKVFNPDEQHFSYPGTLMEYATKYKLLDVWTPLLHVIYASNHKLVFKGDRAKSIWREWNKMQFNKKK